MDRYYRELDVRPGKAFKHWEYLGIPRRKNAYKLTVLCRCSKCGFERDISLKDIARRNYILCACESDTKVSSDLALSSYYSSYKASAKKRNIKFDLTLDEFKIITQSKCHYCGIAPSHEHFVERKTKRGYAISEPYICNGIDRCDNLDAYDLENCRPCCTQCNYAKRELDFNTFFSWVERIHERATSRDSEQEPWSIQFEKYMNNGCKR